MLFFSFFVSLFFAYRVSYHQHFFLSYHSFVSHWGKPELTVCLKVVTLLVFSFLIRLSVQGDVQLQVKFCVHFEQ
jgi:hypothetical protein